MFFLITMGDLTSNWNRLTLSEKEGPGCCLDEELSSPEFSIVTKFLTKRVVNNDAIAKTFIPLWRSKNGFKVRHLGDHRALFVFDNTMEVDRVLQSKPWTFDKHLVVMERYSTNSSVDELKLDRTSFWVQVHGLRIKFMKFWEGSYLLPIQESQREVTSFGLEFQWMLLVPYVVDVWFQLVKKSRSGSASNMRDY